MINIRCAKSYCKDYENIENYEEALNSLEKWECHHRNEKYYNQSDLKKLGLYYDCPPCELIFLRRSEHRKLHHSGKEPWNKGKKLSEEYKQKLRKPKSEETKRKISKSQKGRQLSEEHKMNISKAHKGENNPNFGKHFSEEAKKKMSEARKKYWENKRKERK